MPGIGTFSGYGGRLAGAARGAAGAVGGAWSGMAGVGRRTLGGAAIGGAYGGMADDTSVLGGAMMGAGIGRYGGTGAMMARNSYRAWQGAGMGVGFRGGMMGMSFGHGAMLQMKRDAARSTRFITRNVQGYNPFRRMGTRAGM